MAFNSENSSLVVAALKSLTGLQIVSQSDYLNQIHNGINNNTIYQTINPVSLHNSFLAGGEISQQNDNNGADLPHYSLQGNENINHQHDVYSDSQFASNSSFSSQESSHCCHSTNNMQCFIINPNNFMISSLHNQQISQFPQQISQQNFPSQQQISQKFQVFQLTQSHIPQQIQSQMSQFQFQFPQQIHLQAAPQQFQSQQSQISQQIQPQQSQQSQIFQQIQSQFSQQIQSQQPQISQQSQISQQIQLQSQQSQISQQIQPQSQQSQISQQIQSQFSQQIQPQQSQQSQISQQIQPQQSQQSQISQQIQPQQSQQSQISQQIQPQFSQQIQSQFYSQQFQFPQHIQSQQSQQSQISQQNSNQISQKPTTIVIRICTLNGQIIPINNVPIISKISVIKFHIESKTRIPSNQQRLTYSGILLKDNLTLLDYNILNNNAMINLIGQNNEVINFINSDFLDPMYDCDFTNIFDDKRFMRGSHEYRRPCGWKRIAVKVLNKYGDNNWLGKAAKKGTWRYESDPTEWPVSYHGTDKFNAKSIAETGFDITKGKRFKFGYGIYSTPDINVAALFANKFIHNNEVYCLVFQNRVNPQTLNKINTSIGEYWISPKSDDIRPYGICIKKLGKIHP
ncbi:hypothetical protein RclHR1_03410011 [Rhizophagus clarus]|uniref:Ubiquitin-related domain-containing protein n=1 Tax=Rhizophagus clarus TaxID=94130 RepID=A0A2Z6S4T3_9GLOM|nr:hypothetical protein RclHR1_03410011 [Rhizophagus clarus]GES91243.1 ubiquitin-related domain-containing protein [Rhizophagus clarus]